MYMYGWGVPHDDVKAHMWLSLGVAQLSADDDRDRYATARDAVAVRMSADQIAEAQRRARKWTPAPNR